MFFNNDVQNTRDMFFQSWKKYLNSEPLMDLEKQIVAVITDHPEYHDILMSPEAINNKNYHPDLGETNPFLHMGLHIAIREQLATNRPHGIKEIFEKFIHSGKQRLEVEHLFMEQLAECLWLAQRNQQMPNEQDYLIKLQALL